jgi:hypothetical protein
MTCCDNKQNLDTKNLTCYNCTLLSPVKSHETLNKIDILPVCVLLGLNVALNPRKAKLFLRHPLPRGGGVTTPTLGSQVTHKITLK